MEIKLSYTQQEKIEKILELINDEFLEGVALGKKAAA